MSEDIFNEISNCFKMNIDVEGIKKLEKYINELQQENTRLKEEVKLYKNSDASKDKMLLDREESISNLYKENIQLKQSLELAQDVYKNSHKYTSECEDKVIELKRVLKEIREYIKEHRTATVGFFVHSDILLEIIDKGIGEDK